MTNDDLNWSEITEIKTAVEEHKQKVWDSMILLIKRKRKISVDKAKKIRKVFDDLRNPFCIEGRCNHILDIIQKKDDELKKNFELVNKLDLINIPEKKKPTEFVKFLYSDIDNVELTTPHANIKRFDKINIIHKGKYFDIMERIRGDLKSIYIGHYNNGEGTRSKKKPIMFIRYIESSNCISVLHCKPKDHEKHTLIYKAKNFDIICATNKNPKEEFIYIGHYNDGVKE